MANGRMARNFVTKLGEETAFECGRDEMNLVINVLLIRVQVIKDY